MKTFKLPFQKHSSREWVIEKLFDASVRPYQWLRGSRTAWGIRREQFLAMPKGSLGREVGLFLQKNNFNIMEKLESHDVFHALLGYDVDVPSEISMQYFLLGNGRHTWYTWMTVLSGGLILPEHLRYFLQEFKKGKNCTSIAHWNLRQKLLENAQILRGVIFDKKMPPIIQCLRLYRNIHYLSIYSCKLLLFKLLLALYLLY